MESRIEEAVNKKKKGYNCAQAVACTYCDYAGIDEETMFNICQAFGTGMGTLEGTCGAIVGAGVVLGMMNKQRLKTNQDIRKIMQEFKAQNIISVPQSESERGLMLQLAKFNEVIELSFRDRAPHKICEFLYELSNNFNKFYNDTRILSEEDEAKKSSWLSLINLVKNVLEQGLDLLGMESVERM